MTIEQCLTTYHMRPDNIKGLKWSPVYKESRGQPETVKDCHLTSVINIELLYRKIFQMFLPTI